MVAARMRAWSCRTSTEPRKIVLHWLLMTSCSSAEMSTGALESLPRGPGVWAMAEPPRRAGPLTRLRAIAAGAIHRFINVLMFLFRSRFRRGNGLTGLPVDARPDAAPEDDAVTLVIYGVGV